MSDALAHTRADDLCTIGLHAFTGGRCRDCGALDEKLSPTGLQAQPRPDSVTRRGPVEALAMELWEVARRVKDDMPHWDEEFLNPAQRAAMMEIARHVLACFERSAKR